MAMNSGYRKAFDRAFESGSAEKNAHSIAQQTAANAAEARVQAERDRKLAEQSERSRHSLERPHHRRWDSRD